MYISIIFEEVTICISLQLITRSPATAGIANRPLLFLEHRIPMPECIYGSPFYESSGGRQIRLPLLGGDAPRLG